MKKEQKSCQDLCDSCAQSFNPVYCLAPKFNQHSFEPITIKSLRRIGDTIAARLEKGSSWYDYPGLKEKDIECLKRIEEACNDLSGNSIL